MSSNEAEKQLAECRLRIDAIDDTLLTLLNERLLIAQQVGHIKKKQNCRPSEFYNPYREHQILHRFSQKKTSLLKQGMMIEFFKTIFSFSLSLQIQIQIYVLDNPSKALCRAAYYEFGKQVHLTTCQSLDVLESRMSQSLIAIYGLMSAFQVLSFMSIEQKKLSSMIYQMIILPELEQKNTECNSVLSAEKKQYFFVLKEKRAMKHLMYCQKILMIQSSVTSHTLADIMQSFSDKSIQVCYIAHAVFSSLGLISILISFDTKDTKNALEVLCSLEHQGCTAEILGAYPKS
ncbi:MAG: chorismate mutase [Endozoicomonadaceae bacterium]|nr:chorismate mutase [Endozoicomonadaceae bacterium]